MGRTSEILSQEEMILLLQDIYLTEAKVSALAQRFDSSQQIFNIVEPELLRKHNTTDSLYMRSLEYYYQHPEELLHIYEAVVDSLSLKEKKLSREPTRPPFND